MNLQRKKEKLEKKLVEMNKQEKLALAKIYFFEQKFKEILSVIIVIGVIALFIFACYLLGNVDGRANNVCSLSNVTGEDINYLPKEDCISIRGYYYEQELPTVKRIFRGFVMIIGIVIILFSILVIYSWINENWQRAKRRAGLK